MLEEILSEKIANSSGILIISPQMTIFSTFYVGKISSLGILEESKFWSEKQLTWPPGIMYTVNKVVFLQLSYLSITDSFETSF